MSEAQPPLTKSEKLKIATAMRPTCPFPVSEINLSLTFGVDDSGNVLEDLFESRSSTIPRHCKFGSQRPIYLDVEDAWIRNPITHMTRTVLRIQHAVRPDVFDIHILQQRKSQIFIFLKLNQYCPVVIRHRRNVDAEGFEPFSPLCQLDQLALTKGSPIRRTAEQQQQAPFTREIGKVTRCSRVIVRFELRQCCADRRSPVIAIITPTDHWHT